MGWRSRGRRREIHHTVGWLSRETKSDAFKGLPLPGGGVVRVMDKCLYMAALESAGRKLKELYHKSGGREQPGKRESGL
jgi:hypothetical protein